MSDGGNKDSHLLVVDSRGSRGFANQSAHQAALVYLAPVWPGSRTLSVDLFQSSENSMTVRGQGQRIHRQ